ncbi:MAG TPA: CHASE3 domain-containing protein [Acidobacteriaceae bacterium]
MNAIPRRYLVPLLLGGAMLLVGVNTWLAFSAVQALERGQFWVQHTYQVIAQVERIMSAAKDAETGERGYLITGDERYLEPYMAARKELPEELQAFEALTADNPQQQDRIRQMRSRAEQRVALLQKAIDMRRNGESMADAIFAVGGSGKVEMDALRALSDQMESDEQKLLAERLDTLRSRSLRARWTVALASLLDFLLLGLMVRYYVRERRQRVEMELAAERLQVANVQIEASAREIHELNASLEARVQQRTAELETINRELEAFSYSVSHDLRAPLRTVDGFSLALEEDYAEQVDEVGRDYIRRVRAGVQRMGGLIDALLQLSRITRAELERVDFDMTELAESVVAQLRQENADRKIEFVVKPGPEANGDPKLVRVALENMLGNAVKFTGKLEEARIEFGWDAKEKAWYVQDNGAGFDMEYANRLFNAFHRLHGDKDFKGSGIGLATVARVVRRHHGRIWARSAVNKGATFWFTLADGI